MSPYDADVLIASTANQRVRPRTAMAPNGGRELELRYNAKPGFYAVRATAEGMAPFTSVYEVTESGVVTVQVELARDRSRGTPGSPKAPKFPQIPTIPEDPSEPVPVPEPNPNPTPREPAGDTILVEAGKNLTVDLNEGVRLEGRIYGDQTLAYHATWSVLDGPGKVVFANPESAVTSASFEASGTYLLALDVVGHDASGGDILTVNVRDFDGTIYYVAPGGSDQNNGTSVSTPFRTLNRAGRAVRPGDIIRLRGGVYYEYNDASAGVGLPQSSFRTSGTAERPIVIESYPGELAILDGSRRPDGSAFRPEHGPSSPQRPALLYLPSNHYIVRNLEVRHSVGAGIMTTPGYEDGTASHNLYSNLHVHHNHGNGLTAAGLSYRSSNGERIDREAVGNIAEFVVSHHNASTRNGGDSADGIKMSHARGGVIRNSLLYKNSDDGLDFIGSHDMLVEHSAAWLNGFYWGEGDTDPYDESAKLEARNGNGQGFKMAGQSSGPNSGNMAVRNVAWGNKSFGFTFNGGGGVHFYHNTSWANGSGGFTARCFATSVLRNNLSFEEDQLITSEASTCSRERMPVDDHNSWNLGIRDPRFASLDPRDPGYLTLLPDSPAIDEGRDVGLRVRGSRPDLGAFEAGESLGVLTPPLDGSFEAATAPGPVLPPPTE